jgi:hypothetical protein
MIYISSCCSSHSWLPPSIHVRHHTQGWGFSSVEECLPSKCKALSLVPSQKKKKKKLHSDHQISFTGFFLTFFISTFLLKNIFSTKFSITLLPLLHSCKNRVHSLSCCFPYATNSQTHKPSFAKNSNTTSVFIRLVLTPASYLPNRAHSLLPQIKCI